MGRAAKIERNLKVKKEAYLAKEKAWRDNIRSMDDNSIYGIDYAGGLKYLSGKTWKEFFKGELG